MMSPLLRMRRQLYADVVRLAAEEGVAAAAAADVL